jgi:Porin subfamily
MNIKSLLLGSAAALAAVSGARAADAVVVAEPEPVEYVRVCDVYGAGFYYIPGTETCLRVGGYLRYDVRGGKGGYGGLNDVIDKKDFAQGIADGLSVADAAAAARRHDTYYQRARAAVQLDARSETELGTLRGYMHVDFNFATGTVDVVDANKDVVGAATSTSDTYGIEHAFIELGGFRVGKTDSLFATFTGYAGNVIEDDLISYAGGADADYGTHQIAYTFTGGNGFSAAVAVEDGADKLYTIDSYAPHVVAGAAFTQGWGGVSGVVGYDSVWEEWAGKARLDVNVNDQLALFVMAGYGTEKNITRSFYKGWGGHWAVWGGGTFKVNEKAALNLQASWSQNKDVAVVANVAYTLVPGFTITPEVAWNSVHEDVTKEKIRDGFGGMVRFQRSF